MFTLLVNLTESDLRKGSIKDPAKCAISRAIKRELPDGWRVLTGGIDVLIFKPDWGISIWHARLLLEHRLIHMIASKFKGAEPDEYRLYSKDRHIPMLGWKGKISE